ncbi:25715_t:CDS:2, partial [Racocetra persica]
LDDDFEGQARFQLEFNINSESIDEVLINADQDRNLCIANLVINEISNGDVDDISKQRSTEAFIERYNCKGVVVIKVNSKNNIIFVKMSHDLLHPRPEKFNVTTEIKDYINTCIRQNVPDIYQLIKDQNIKGYESLTIKQVHYWWSKMVQAEYRSSDDELAS